MRPTRGSLAPWPCVLVAAVTGSALAAPPPSPEHGLKGLRRVELVFTNLAYGGEGPGGIAKEKPNVSPVPPTNDLERQTLPDVRECSAIAQTLSRDGLEVVEHCRFDDLACARLFLTVETTPVPDSQDRVYLVESELNQRVRLARDPTVDLLVPITWSARSFGIVAGGNSARIRACLDLGGLASQLAAHWKVANP